MTDPHNTSAPYPPVRHSLVPWVIGMGLLAAGIAFYSLTMGSRAAKLYAPLADAAMVIKFEAALGHLWLEEALTGDREVGIADVLKHLDRSEWYARAMLEGGENAEGVFIPLDDPELRRKIEGVLVKIDDFRLIAKKRWAAREQSDIGTETDKRFDAVFEDLLNQADEVETALQIATARDLARFRILQTVLIAIVLGLSVLVAFSVRYYQRQNALDTVALRDSEERFRTLVRNIPGVSYRCELDEHWTMIFISDEAKTLTGYPDSDFLQNQVRSFASILYSQDKQGVQDVVKQKAAGKNPFEIEYRIHRQF